MDVAGLQKMTLLDFPGRLACTVFLGGCNFRCPFCHNASLVLPERRPAPLMTGENLLDFLRGRRGKLEGVCLTGGEPTLQRELPRLAAEIKAMGFAVKLDTNGTRPEVLRTLVQEGLVDYVAMDVKTAPERYPVLCGVEVPMDAVRESAALLLSGAVDYEFRTTLVKPLHTAEDLRQTGRWLRGAKRYFLQQFVDSGDLVGQGMEAFTLEEMEALRQIVLPDIPEARLRGL